MLVLKNRILVMSFTNGNVITSFLIKGNYICFMIGLSEKENGAEDGHYIGHIVDFHPT